MPKQGGINPFLSDSELMKREYKNGKPRKVMMKVCLDLPKESNGAD